MPTSSISKTIQSSQQWVICEIDRIAYGKALKLQHSLWSDVKTGEKDQLLLLEHEPVITLGRRTDNSHLLWSKEKLEQEGIELFNVERGGSATYHGPGQLVGYIICKTSRYGGIHSVVSNVLKLLQITVSKMGISCKIDKDNPGLWTDTEIPKKLGAVGMRNKKGVSLHGFALNVDLPLTGFSAIVPCGLTLPVSTLAIELGRNIDLSEVKKILVPAFSDLFGS